MNTRKLITLATVLALSLLLAYSPAMAKATYTLKFNHVLSPKDPFHAGFLKWAEAVEKRTKGDLEVQVFHSAQLGVEEDIIEQIRAGFSFRERTLRTGRPTESPVLALPGHFKTSSFSAA